MTATTLLVVFDSVYLIALAAWVGSIMYLSFGVAPLIFGGLDPESGAKFVRALFPRYYAWGAISGSLAMPAAMAAPLLFPELRGPAVGVQAGVILAGVLLMLYAGNTLTPAINRARDAGPPEAGRFQSLHLRSVQLNGLVLLLGLGLLVAFAARPSPRRSGVVERVPSVPAAAAEVPRGR